MAAEGGFIYFFSLDAENGEQRGHAGQFLNVNSPKRKIEVVWRKGDPADGGRWGGAISGATMVTSNGNDDRETCEVPTLHATLPSVSMHLRPLEMYLRGPPESMPSFTERLSG